MKKNPLLGVTRRSAIALMTLGVTARAAEEARPKALKSDPPGFVATEVFAAQGRFALPRLSPDGAHLAVRERILVNEREVQVLTIYRLADMNVRSQLRMPIFELPLDYQWVDSSRLVISKGVESGRSEVGYDTGELIAVDLDGTNSLYVYGYLKKGQPDNGWASIEGLPTQRNGHFYMRDDIWRGREERSVVSDVDSRNGARREVARLPVAEVTFVLDGQGRAVWANGSTVDREFVLFKREADGDGWRTVRREEAGGRLEPVALVDPGGDFVALFSADDGPRSAVLQSADLKTRKVLATDPVGNMDQFQFRADGRPFATSSAVGRPQVTYLDAQSSEARLHQAIAEQFPEAFVRLESCALDGSRVLLCVISDRDPGSYYLFDRASGRAEFLFASNPGIEPEQMAARRPIKFAARDGLELHAYLTVPLGRPTKNLPLVLLPHGGPQYVADTWFYDADAQFLANRGFAVLQVNYRGSGGRGSRFHAAGFNQWGGKMLEDLADGVRWAVAVEVADAGRVGVFGGSYGGYAAMMMPVIEPGMFRCAAGLAGAYDLSLLLSNDAARRYDRSKRFYERAFGSDPATRSPVQLADRIKVPVFIAHGAEDKRTEPLHAERMRSALERAGNPPEWMMVPREGHGFYKPANQVAFYDRLEAFLAKHLRKPSD